jgi:beta-barrel assembly-enhancing protease
VNLRFPALLAAVSLAFSTSAQVLPDLGDASSATLSETQERTIGNRIMREARNDPAFIDDAEIADYVSALGSRLLSGLEGPARRDLDFFAVLDDSINAFAMVGGHVGVHTGLILLTQSESELAAVVAHEIAHVVQRHQARMASGMGRAQITSLAALAVAILAARAGNQSGQMTEAAMATAGALQIQNLLDYTREHEREADRVGLTMLDRAGFDSRGAATVFERLMRANRLNEFKGAPSYLRTHPLTSERIADMQDRLDRAPVKMIADSFEYRLVKAKLRALSGSPAEAVAAFRTILSDRTIVRPREDVYGLAFALRRARDLDTAWQTLAPIREGKSHPAFEVLAAEIRADQGRHPESLAIYRAALKGSGHYRALIYGYIEALLATGHVKEAVADLEERLRNTREDARLYRLQARAWELSGRPISQYRALAEAAFHKGNLAAAVEQLELAVKVKGPDYYEVSSAESRLRELKRLLENERAAEKALKITS